MTIEPAGHPSDRVPVPAPRVGGWTDSGPPEGFAAIVVGFRLIHRRPVIDGAAELLAARLGWAFQPGRILPSRHDSADVRMYGNLLVPVPAAVVSQLTSPGGDRRGRPAH